MTDRTWDLFVELRKEILESQRIRAQVIGFKITFVTAAIGLIFSSEKELDPVLFAVPAFAALFLDFLIYSYSFSIKRIGSYIRVHLEPALKRHGHFPDDLTLWQAHLTDPSTRQTLSLYGNLGFSVLVVAVAVLALLQPFRPVISLSVIIALFALVALDFAAYRSPRRLGTFLKHKGGVTSGGAEQGD